MAVTVITPTRLTAGAVSADLNVSDGIVATSQTDGWSVVLGARGKASQLLVVIVDDGSGSTLTFKAGDLPSAKQASKGDYVVTMAASDCFWWTPEPGRHEQDDQTITIINNDAGAKCIAFLFPYGTDGGSAIA